MPPVHHSPSHRDSSHLPTACVQRYFGNIDCESADAYLPEDRERIHEAIRSSIGFEGLDEAVITRLYSWLAGRAVAQLRALPEPERVKKAWKFVRVHQLLASRGAQVQRFLLLPFPIAAAAAALPLAVNSNGLAAFFRRQPRGGGCSRSGTH